MITHIRVQNFKSWKDSGEVKLAPLTGFFGTNSSGKSSLLQMLLLLKQTMRKEEVIFFGDENSLVNLGNFREVIHGHDVEATLKLEFGCRTQTPLTIEAGEPNSDVYSSFYPLVVDSFTFDAAIQEQNKQPIFEHAYYIFGSDNELKIEWWSDNLVHPGGYQSNVILRGDYDGSEANTEDLLKHLTSSFEYRFDHIYPLGPTRVHPKRLYHWEGTDPNSVGQSGEDMIASLLNARVDQRTTPYKGKDVPIEDRISWWLREMDLGYAFSIKRSRAGTDRDYDVLIQKGPDSAKVTLADMGYGLSQFLPVLVHCYYAPEGSTLILEQPGIHLHPKAQADLADLLIEIITERNLQVLIESHSEHLLTRLQLGIAEQKIAFDQTALYFCENDNGVSTIKSLGVDELGNITNWPPDFFGNVRGDLVKMTREQMKRQKETEGE